MFRAPPRSKFCSSLQFGFLPSPAPPKRFRPPSPSGLSDQAALQSLSPAPNPPNPVWHHTPCLDGGFAKVDRHISHVRYTRCRSPFRQHYSRCRATRRGAACRGVSAHPCRRVGHSKVLRASPQAARRGGGCLSFGAAWKIDWLAMLSSLFPSQPFPWPQPSARSVFPRYGTAGRTAFPLSHPPDASSAPSVVLSSPRLQGVRVGPGRTDASVPDSVVRTPRQCPNSSEGFPFRTVSTTSTPFHPHCPFCTGPCGPGILEYRRAPPSVLSFGRIQSQ